MILDIIKPIKLLAGSHANTGETGQGCFMNVIAYLNGEAQITDQSTCVCPSMRKLLLDRLFMVDATWRRENYEKNCFVISAQL